MSDRFPARPGPAADVAEAFARVVEAALARAAGAPDAAAFHRAPPGAFDALPALGPTGRPVEQVAQELLDRVLPYAMSTDHRRFFAFIPSPASPLSWLGELLTAVHNAHAGAAVQSEGATAIERRLISFLCKAAGLPSGAGGLFVSGGSMANLTALTAARDRLLGEDERELGVAYLGEGAHASIAKALRIIGVADRRVRIVASDRLGRLDAGDLTAAVAADRAAGLRPFVVVATAGATNTGAIDPLDAVADVCAAERLWMHVDGAYGASALLSPAHRGLLRGIGRADSLTWDAHKWLFQTYGCGAVLVRDRSALADAFRMGADYLRDGDAPDGEPNAWDLGPELTRPARATKLWLTLQTLGLDAVGAAIARGIAAAETAERAVRATPDWRIVSEARLAIVCFRYAPPGVAEAEADALNRAIAKAMLEDGFAVVGATRVEGRAAIRMCTINPATTDEDLSGTVDRLDAFARALLPAFRLQATG
ncbi:pyridoxal phosphate-dependent decarboxylase family protein [Hansschlegelia sp. KR7-227]|uniref:pyridoxal phosphate-dependent decarboxylase family protein n=1 Tax=Hansschlegelia sp. KR7-227 TaxID=3400914 RepID=UPI003C02CA96